MNKNFDEDPIYSKGWKDGFEVAMVICAISVTATVLILSFLIK